MTDLSPLLHGPGGHTLAYTDPAFPDQPLLLHGACPRHREADTEGNRCEQCTWRCRTRAVRLAKGAAVVCGAT